MNEPTFETVVFAAHLLEDDHCGQSRPPLQYGGTFVKNLLDALGEFCNGKVCDGPNALVLAFARLAYQTEPCEFETEFDETGSWPEALAPRQDAVDVRCAFAVLHILYHKTVTAERLVPLATGQRSQALGALVKLRGALASFFGFLEDYIRTVLSASLAEGNRGDAEASEEPSIESQLDSLLGARLSEQASAISTLLRTLRYA